jgi:hypothetical protein
MNVRVGVGRVSRIFLLASAALATLLLGAAASASAGTLDQQQTSSDADLALLSDQTPAQTFTAGISGGLDQVDLLLLKFGTPPPSVTVEIRNTSAGEPEGAVLAIASLSTSAIGTSPGFIPVAFAAPAPVAAGTQYAIVAYSPGTGGNTVEWRYQVAGNPYSPGAMFVSNATIPPGGGFGELGGSDLAFKTYVVSAPPVKPTATCQGQQASQVGTAGNDVITGTGGNDVIAALAGNDKVSGLSGKDLICGGAGKDTLNGGGGKDTLLGQGGKDKLRGAGAKDICKGGKGNDSGKCEVEKSL